MELDNQAAMNGAQPSTTCAYAAIESGPPAHGWGAESHFDAEFPRLMCEPAFLWSRIVAFLQNVSPQAKQMCPYV